MWYRIAINLSNLPGFNSTETDVELKDGGIRDVPEKLVSGLEANHEKLDEIYNFGGYDTESEKFINIANTIMQVSQSLVPLLSSIIKLLDKDTPLKFLIKKQFSLMALMNDMRHVVDACEKLEAIQDPQLRIKKFTEYFRASGGLHGVFTSILAAFNTMTKFLNIAMHLSVKSPVDLSTASSLVSVVEYLFEESREDEHKSGVNLLKTKVVNPHIEFLVKKNPNNKIIVNYVKKYIEDNPDKTHEEVRNEALGRFLRNEKKSKFRNMPNSKYSYIDIVHIVDNLYQDPHDYIPALKDKRISKEYYDNFMEFLGNASSIQMKITRASFNMGKLLSMLPHI